MNFSHGQEVEKVIVSKTDPFKLYDDVIAWPIAYMITNNWLNNYAYRIEQNIFSYLLAFISILLTAYILISAQCFNTANSNPSENLRSE